MELFDIPQFRQHRLEMTRNLHSAGLDPQLEGGRSEAAEASQEWESFAPNLICDIDYTHLLYMEASID
eukprot:CAMPEP_0172193500 /NCGR_PEP_ID=MMETSP1050-20130122/25004_1 /TAXON_ID=233186 /ORGANISM="Cryptomonas curvata, Strain CCAP979/52" /LENGTH=67 /DNA_ID=CAMNT_0012869093 /DNA_START=310 /DNA_END=513 /DNA_ORIENTATION=-